MMLLKNSAIKVKKSFGRFLSLLIIVAVGVGFFSGIRASAPDITASVDDYYREMSLFDFQIISTLGLTQEDVKAIEALPLADTVVPGHFIDVLSDGQAIRVHSISADSCQIQLVEGNMPAKAGECLADAEKYHVGDRIPIEGAEEELKYDEYIVVGTVHSPRYIFREYGIAGVGDGKLVSFIYVNESDFLSEYFTEILVCSQEAQEAGVYSETYENAVAALKLQLQTIQTERQIMRWYQIQQEGNDEIRSAEKELSDAKLTAEKELAEAKRLLQENQLKLEEAYQKLADGAAQLASQKEQGEHEFITAQQQFDLAFQEIELMAQQQGIDISQMDMLLAQLQMNIDALQRHLADFSTESDAYQQLVAQLDEYEAMRESLSALQQQYVQLEQELTEIQERQQAIEHTLQAYEITTDQLPEKILLIQQEITQLQEQLAATEPESEEYLFLLQAIKNKGQQLRTLQDIQQEISQLQEQSTIIQTRMTEIEQNLSQQNITIEEVPQKLLEIEEVLSQLYAQKEELTPGSTTHQSLLLQLEECNAAYENVLTLKNTYQILISQQQKLTSEKQNFELQIQKAQKELWENEQKLVQSKQILENSQKDYVEQKAKIQEEFIQAQEEIDSAKTELQQLEQPKWYLQERNALSGYGELKEDVEKVTLIARILPLFFVLIAVLMSLNTMTRMIEEERGELGIFLSLGYGRGRILWMYLLYVLIASIIGVVSGFFVGCSLIPRIVYTCYQANYILPALQIHYDMAVFLLMLLCALGSMMTVTTIVCTKELKCVPAALLRPAPPKKGQTILLEHISPIWKRLSFIWKVTIRNMFRYKKRVLMTIIGISGCTAILLTGFGIRDSIDGVAQLQYGEIFHYDSLILLEEEQAGWQEELQTVLEENHVEDPLLLKQMTFSCESDGTTVVDSYLIVPQNEELFSRYFSLRSLQNHEAIELPENSVVITQKLADLLSLQLGDFFSIHDTEGNVYKLQVGAIAENYIMHYIYMQPELYKQIWGEQITYNAIAATYHGDSGELSTTLLEQDIASYISFTEDGLETFNKLIGSLNQIILLIIAAASLLALIVLYNLVTINISERRREIATLKVLGFFNREVNAYIYRETFLLTLLSIAVGLGLGVLLHRLVIGIAEVQSTVFIKQVAPWSFLWVLLIMISFTILIQVFTYFKLKSIDMIESLKSVE